MSLFGNRVIANEMSWWACSEVGWVLIYHDQQKSLVKTQTRRGMPCASRGLEWRINLQSKEHEHYQSWKRDWTDYSEPSERITSVHNLIWDFYSLRLWKKYIQFCCFKLSILWYFVNSSIRRPLYDLIQLIKGGSIEKQIIQSQKQTTSSMSNFSTLPQIHI